MGAGEKIHASVPSDTQAPTVPELLLYPSAEVGVILLAKPEGAPAARWRTFGQGFALVEYISRPPLMIGGPASGLEGRSSLELLGWFGDTYVDQTRMARHVRSDIESDSKFRYEESDCKVGLVWPNK